MTTPALSALRERYPHAYISYLVEEPYRDLVEGNKDLDEVISIPVSPSWEDFSRIIHRLRKTGYDAVVDFHGGPKAFLFTLFAKAKLRIGHKIKYKHFFYDIKIERKTEEKPIHSVENHFKLVTALYVKSDQIPRFKLPPAKEAEAAKILEFLSKNKLEDTRIIALHISAGNEFRKWDLQKLNRLIVLLSMISKVSIVLIGSPEDRALEAQILKENPIPLFSLVGCLNLRELKELISRSSLFIGPDSGPMHIAAATDTPIVACFGPALSATFRPWRASSTILEKDYPCRPCSQKKCIFGDFRCFQDIMPEEIYQASCVWLPD
ncbi:MAG: glycosyltransferase family 9 protein [Candidatus Aminicenantes bacterium]|nr:glycosyltransferase family 9 protein [Candidatus Aminicenantes bacterium]